MAVPATPTASAQTALSTRKIVHIAMLGFAFLLPFLTWVEAAGAALLALLFNLFILPRMEVDLRKRVGGNVSPDVWTGIVAYPVSVLLLILLYRHSMHVVAATWAIMALGDGAAGVVGGAVPRPALPWNREKTWAGWVAFVLAGMLGAYALTRWVAPSLPEGRVGLVSVAAAMVGATLESLPIRLDDNLTVPIVTGAFMFGAYFVTSQALAGNAPYLGKRAAIGLGVNLAFALAAWALKLVDRSGAAAGLVLGTLIYLGYGGKSFLILLAFFLLGSAATRLGYAAKAARGTAERRGGARSWREAAANLLPGAFFSILAISTPYSVEFLTAFVAAFAEAAGDTVSSEIGQWLSDRAYLITTMRPVPAGENGGVSLVGSVAALSASALMVALGLGLGMVGRRGAAVALGAALAGNLLDSVLGATLERRGLVTNGVVNFAGTSFAGGLAIAWLWHFGV